MHYTFCYPSPLPPLATHKLLLPHLAPPSANTTSTTFFRHHTLSPNYPNIWPPLVKPSLTLPINPSTTYPSQQSSLSSYPYPQFASGLPSWRSLQTLPCRSHDVRPAATSEVSCYRGPPSPVKLIHTFQCFITGSEQERNQGSSVRGHRLPWRQQQAVQCWQRFHGSKQSPPRTCPGLS